MTYLTLLLYVLGYGMALTYIWDAGNQLSVKTFVQTAFWPLLYLGYLAFEAGPRFVRLVKRVGA